VKTAKLAALALACISLLSTAAQASIINFDLNGRRDASVGTTYTGNGVLRADNTENDNPAAGTSSGLWNGVSFPTDPNSPSPSSGFVDSSGSPVSTTLAFSDWGFQDNCPDCNYAQPGHNPADMSLLNDYLGAVFPTTPSPTVTIGGLTPGFAYTLFIYGTNGGSGAGGTWSVNGSATQQTTGNGPSPFSTFSNGNDYTKFIVNADLGGNLVITATKGPNDNPYAILNGFQIAVPEPASLSLLAAGGLALLRRRK
jgi:hypothetical protein